MTDFFTRLAQRTLGVVPTVQPMMASLYAPSPDLGDNALFEITVDEEVQNGRITGQQYTPLSEQTTPPTTQAMPASTQNSQPLPRTNLVDPQLDSGAREQESLTSSQLQQEVSVSGMTVITSLPPVGNSPAKIASTLETGGTNLSERQGLSVPHTVYGEHDTVPHKHRDGHLSTESFQVENPQPPVNSTRISPTMPIAKNSSIASQDLLSEQSSRARGGSGLSLPVDQEKRLATSSSATSRQNAVKVETSTASLRNATEGRAPARPLTEKRHMEPIMPLAEKRRQVLAELRSTQEISANVASPTIQVTIGRIEVRATPAPMPSEPSPASYPTTPTVMSLDDYLHQRAKGGH